MLAAHEARAHTAVLVAIDGTLAGVLAIADTVKADAWAAVAEMKARGVMPVMLTGDNRRTAEAVAAQVGIAEVHAQVLPQDKAERVRAIQGLEGARVVMAGDGINDAPALMQADVGVAVGAGTDIAIESSDVIVIGDRVGAIMEARAIGALSYRKTLQNLWLAFFFNGLGVPLAASGLVHPAWAMIAMAASVSAVLANSFGGRLLRPREQAPAAPAAGQGETVETVLSVPGIHCAACVDTIEAYLKTDPGVLGVEGDARTKELQIVFRPDETDQTKIRSMIARMGYKVG